MKKRILLLGGSFHQIPIIKEAKQRGLHVITCDYLPDNPGHKLADEYYNVSTTDYEGVLELAKKVKPDYIVAYASDPAAPVAAYVSEKLGLQGNSYDSIRLLSEKDLFRSFMKQNGYNVPEIAISHKNDNTYKILDNLKLPFIVKPTDSSGSKGVSKVLEESELQSAVDYAFQFSRNQRIIAEEFIDNELADIHGDGFVVDGNLVFSCLGDHIYNSHSNPYNPIGTLWPSKQSGEVIQKIEKDVAGLIKKTGFKQGPVNIEARVNRKGKHYIMEVGPRSGGHFVPQAIHHATGFDMVKGILDQLEGKQIIIPSEDKRKPVAYYAIHSDQEGILTELNIDKSLSPFIKELHQYIKLGETVKAFHGANAAIGVIVLCFDSFQETDYYIDNIGSYIRLNIRELS